MSACAFYRPTIKGGLCACGWKFREHSEDVRDKYAVWRWGWRARHLSQPDSEDCE